MSIARIDGIARLIGVVAATTLVACGPADLAADTNEFRASQRGSVPLGDQYYPRSATSIEVEVQTCSGDPSPRKSR